MLFSTRKRVSKAWFMTFDEDDMKKYFAVTLQLVLASGVLAQQEPAPPVRN
jgi:hypothetical protein